MSDLAIKRQEAIPKNGNILQRTGKTFKELKLEQLVQELGANPKSTFEDLYFRQNLTQDEIAHRLHKHPETIRYWFKICGILTPHTKRGGRTRREQYIEEVNQLLGGDPKKILEDLYFKQGLSTDDIAKRFNTSQTTVSKWFEILNILTNRSKRAGMTKRKRNTEKLKQLLGGEPKEVLEDLYFNQGLSQNDIAILFHKNRSSVTNWFEILGMSTYRSKRADRTPNKRQLEKLKKLLGEDPKAALEDLHFSQGLTQNDIAKRLHMNRATVSIWFKRFGITVIRNRMGKKLREKRLKELEQLLGGDPKTILEDLYFKQGLTQEDIANRFHIGPGAVNNWFKVLGISGKPHAPMVGASINSEAQQLVLSASKDGSFEKLSLRQKELLTLRYLQSGLPLTLAEIAEKMGGITRQGVHELEKTTLHYLQVNKTPLEQLLGGDPKEVLEDLHLKQGLSQKDIADRFHKNPTTVSKWFKRFGISAKTNSQRKLEQLKQLLGGDPKKILEDLYIKQGLSMTAIANRFHKTPLAVSGWVKKFDIKKQSQLVRQHARRMNEDVQENTSVEI